MFSLLNEIHFWTTQDNITIKDTDFGAFKYSERKDDVIASKRNYTEKRKYLHNITNKRPFKLKEKLKELEELLKQDKIIYYKWTESNILEIMLSTGLFIYVFVDGSTGDVEKITFDKYLIGKLLTNCITDVIKTKSHILCAYNDNRITLIHLTKKNPNTPIKLSRLEPRIHTYEMAGPSSRRLDRKMSSNLTGDRLLIWWKSSTDEVYPWSPLVKDQDRANIHIYSLFGAKLELLCYKRTEFDPLEVVFDYRQLNLIHCIEQKVSRRGNVSVEVSTFEVIRNKLQMNHVTSIPLQTQICCCALSPDEEMKLVLGCIDGCVVLFDRMRGVTNLVKAAFIPTMCSWHPSSSFLYIANERSQFQCFDLALACVKNQLVSDDLLPSNVLDVTSYFKQQPTLLHFAWNTPSLTQNMDSLLVLFFDKGPIAILRLFDYNGTIFDACNLVHQYVEHGNIEKSINILLSLDWNTVPEKCLLSLQTILNHLFRCKFTQNIESQIQKALGSFYAPIRPISNGTKSDIGDQIADLTRKFFHSLIRHQLFEKAFCLAIDIGDHDLFMDLYYVAKCINDAEMADAAISKATELIDDSSGSSSSTNSSCSQCSDGVPNINNENPWDNIPPLPNINPIIPPLPSVSLNLPPKYNTYNRLFTRNPQVPPVPVIIHKTISLNIPPVNTITTTQVPLKINVPLNIPSTSSGGAIQKFNPERGEKNVKFSDTVTAFIVPELPRTEKTKRVNASVNAQINHPFITNPKRELQDSLPLCHPEDEYLKDFTPIANREEVKDEAAPKIKVVHFGMV